MSTQFLFDTSPYVAPTIPHSRKMEIWQAFHIRVNAIADRVRKLKRERAAVIWLRAFGSPMPPLNCVHNATLDDQLNGWCTTRAQLRAARQCKALLHDWDASHVADRASKRKWSQLFSN